MGSSGEFSLVWCLTLNIPPKHVFSEYLGAIACVIGPVCAHEEMESISSGSRACVSSRRNPVLARQTSLKTKPNGENQTMETTAGAII